MLGDELTGGPVVEDDALTVLDEVGRGSGQDPLGVQVLAGAQGVGLLGPSARCQRGAAVDASDQVRLGQLGQVPADGDGGDPGEAGQGRAGWCDDAGRERARRRRP